VEHIRKRSSTSAAPLLPQHELTPTVVAPLPLPSRPPPAEPTSTITTTRDTDLAVVADSGIVTRMHLSDGVVTRLWPARIPLDGTREWGRQAPERCQDCGVYDSCGKWVSSLGMDLARIALVACHIKTVRRAAVCGRCVCYYCDSGCTRRRQWLINGEGCSRCNGNFDKDRSG